MPCRLVFTRHAFRVGRAGGTIIAMRTLTAYVLCAFFVTAPAFAQAETIELQAAPPPAMSEPIRNWVNLRVGAQGSELREASNMCLEIAPLAILSVEACGTGSRVLYPSSSAEMSHWRMYGTLYEWEYEKAWLRPRIGAGFAELQVAADSPGFFFGGTDPNRAETAGPEGVASLQMLYPLVGGLEVVAEMNVGVAWLRHAGDLVRPMNDIQPFGGLTVGLGW